MTIAKNLIRATGSGFIISSNLLSKLQNCVNGKS